MDAVFLTQEFDFYMVILIFFTIKLSVMTDNPSLQQHIKIDCGYFC